MSSKNTKTRICHINTRHLNGGGAKTTFHLLKGLDKTRFEIHFIVGRDFDSAAIQTLENQGVKVIILDALIRSINPYNDFRALYQLTKLIKQNQYDIVHTHYAKAGILGRFASALSGSPVILHTLHGLTFTPATPALINLFYIWLERLAARFTDIIIAVGKDLLDIYLDHGIGEKSQYIVIHSGIDLKPFAEIPSWSKQRKASIRKDFGVPADQITLCMIARFVDGKGHDYAIEAADRIRKIFPEFCIFFVGDGPLLSKYKQQVMERGLQDHIIFAGYQEDVTTFLALSDLVIHTSLWEGVPQALVQAAAAGKPIVTFNVAGANEIVQDGRNGYIVPVGDVDQLTQKTCSLLADPAEMRAFTAQSKLILNKAWEIETMISKTTQLYEDLVTLNGDKGHLKWST